MLGSEKFRNVMSVQYFYNHNLSGKCLFLPVKLINVLPLLKASPPFIEASKNKKFKLNNEANSKLIQNTTAYHSTGIITTVNSCIVQAPVVRLIKIAPFDVSALF